MPITSTVIAHSITPDGQEIITVEWEYPRIIHSENMTHRIFSRNSASSRAIPVEKMNELIFDNGVGKPWRFGKANKGMQDAGEHNQPVFIDALYKQYLSQGMKVDEAYSKACLSPEDAWEYGAKFSVGLSNAFDSAGYAKQVCNRLTEPYQHMKVVVTTTSFDNYMHLRYHQDADPTIHMLAVVTYESIKDSKPRVLRPGEWHVPYYYDGFWTDAGNGVDYYGVSLDDALKISASCCAQASYRALDDSVEKAKSVFKRLIESQPVHASPVEHQATPIKDKYNPAVGIKDWQDGITHVDRNGNFWSGNFKGWIQHRQLIANHVCDNFELI